MRSAFLDDARSEALTHAVRDVLERRGALVSEHRHSRVRFQGPPSPHRLTWAREGYVGVYQPHGEAQAEVRLILRARWPWRILVGVAAASLATFLVTLAVNPSGTTWSVLAILCGFALLASGIVYVNTLKSVREEERRLMEDIEAALHHEVPDARVETEEERELRELEAELEGEITQRRVVGARPPPEKGRRFSLRPRAAQTESAEDKRARLLARKAELEARRREQDGKL